MYYQSLCCQAAKLFILEAYPCELKKCLYLSIELLHNEKYLKLNKYRYNVTVNLTLLMYEVQVSNYETKPEWES